MRRTDRPLPGPVKRVRAQMLRAAFVRALLRGTAAGCLVGIGIVLGTRLFGATAGAGLLLAVLPGIAAAVLSFLRERPSPEGAALLLDRVAGTRERFVTLLGPLAPPVREFIAAQAEELGRGARVSFPPGPEGPGAALTLVVLVLLVLALPSPARFPESGTEAAPGPALVARGAADEGVPGEREGEAVEPGPGSPRPPGASRPSLDPDAMTEDGVMSPEEQEELAKAGVGEDEIEAARAALLAGDPDRAAAALRAALAAAADREESPGQEPGAPTEGAWARYERSLAEPTWNPRFDRVVKAWFTEGAGRDRR